MVNWQKRGAKILGSFFTGYGGGFSAMLTGQSVVHPNEINFVALFFLPLLSGLVVTFPQLGKVFNELGGKNNA